MSGCFWAALPAIAWLLSRASMGSPRDGHWRSIAWMLVFCGLGAIRAGSTGRELPDGPRERSLVRVSGRAFDLPISRRRADERRENGRQLSFNLRSDAGRTFRVMASVSSPHLLRVGESVVVRGVLLTSRPIRNPGEHRDNRHDLLVVSHESGIQRIGVSERPRPLSRFREKLRDLALAMYPGESSGLILALTLGDRRLLPEALREDLRLTGTYHYLAISGLHVGILLWVILRLPLGPRCSALAVLAFLALFPAMTGGAPPVLRATIMAALFLLSRGLDRRSHPLGNLGWTALLLLACRPEALFDIGFQFSFVAVLGIMTWGRELVEDGGSSFLQPRERRRRARRRRLRNALIISLSASLLTAPLTAYYFGRMHPTGFIWSLLALPFVSVILIGGCLSLLVACVHSTAGCCLAYLVSFPMTAVCELIHIAAGTPGSCVFLTPPSSVIVLGVYSVIAMGLWPRLKRLSLCLVLGILCIALCLQIRHKPSRWLQLDVGDGDVAILRTSDSGNFLIDAGGRGFYSGRLILQALRACGVHRLDCIFITHPHQDHVSGLEEVLAGIRVECIAAPAGWKRFSLGRKIARECNVRVVELSRGARMQFGAMKVRVVSPQLIENLPHAKRANEMSLGLLFRYENASWLALGDLEEAGVARLLSSEDDLHAGTLLAPHHGRRNLIFDELVTRVEPETIIYSGSGRGGARESCNAYEKRGYRVLATWRGGAISQELRDGTWHSGYWLQTTR